MPCVHCNRAQPLHTLRRACELNNYRSKYYSRAGYKYANYTHKNSTPLDSVYTSLIVIYTNSAINLYTLSSEPASTRASMQSTFTRSLASLRAQARAREHKIYLVYTK